LINQYNYGFLVCQFNESDSNWRILLQDNSDSQQKLEYKTLKFLSDGMITKFLFEIVLFGLNRYNNDNFEVLNFENYENKLPENKYSRLNDLIDLYKHFGV